MSSFKSTWSSVKYHAITQPSINVAKGLGRALGRKFAPKVQEFFHKRGYGRKPGARQNVLHATRGKIAAKLGHKPGSKAIFSKATKTGQARRQQAANYAKYLQRPKRSKTGNVNAIKLLPGQSARPSRKPAPAAHVTPTRRAPVPTPKVTSKKSNTVATKITKTKLTKAHANRTVAGAIAGSKTHGQLKRRLGGLAVRSITRTGHPPGTHVKEAARKIRALRNRLGPSTLRGLVKQTKANKIAEASRQLGRKI